LGPILSEDDWLASGDPGQMIEFLHESGSARRWLLFGCNCMWRILPLLVDERSHYAVSVAEREAQGQATPVEHTRTLDDANAALLEMWQRDHNPALTSAAIAAIFALSSPRRAWVHAAQATGGGERAEREAQCRLLRELFGNPFRPCVVEPAWC